MSGISEILIVPRKAKGVGLSRRREELVDKAKPFDIPKREVWEAFKRVKANQGAAGVDRQSIADFEADLSNNLYKLWNRLSSGSYFPPPVRRVDIPKADGGTRPLRQHRICTEALAKRFPEITVDTNQRIIDDGDIITAGGFLAWVDVGLLLVDKILGGAVRAETARFIFPDSATSAARYFPSFAPRQAHGDTAVLKAQEWVQTRDGRDVSLASMAAAAGLERRTFLRRFAHATGMTPIEYCRAVRIARARELLECGNTPQKEIAQSLGYEDVASFARVFRKVTGLAPGAYRKQFGLNAVSPGYFAQRRAAVTQPPQLTANPELMDRGSSLSLG
jgi:AraC-like DNA-binding protein